LLETSGADEFAPAADAGVAAAVVGLDELDDPEE